MVQMRFIWNLIYLSFLLREYEVGTMSSYGGKGSSLHIEPITRGKNELHCSKALTLSIGTTLYDRSEQEILKL
jgi:hypothetical protein